MAQQLFDREPSPWLRGYAVWVPKAGGRAAQVGAAAARVPDPRVAHFWDAAGRALVAFRAPLAIDQDAWDVYLLYPPGVRWDGEAPPRPAFWMHQLDALRGGPIPPLDAARFAARARALLPR